MQEVTYGDMVLVLILMGGMGMMIALMAIKEEIEKHLNK